MTIFLFLLKDSSPKLRSSPLGFMNGSHFTLYRPPRVVGVMPSMKSQKRREILHNLGWYSQHTQAEDARHGVTVSEQVAPIPPVLAQPPLALLFADGPVVDRQVFHLSSSPDLLFILLPSASSPFALALNSSLQASLLVFSVYLGWELS